MKEFSESLAPDRKFEIGGSVLEWKYPYFEDMGPIYEYDRWLSTTVAEDPDSVDPVEVYRTRITQIERFLTPESAEKWRVIAGDRDDPVPPFMIGNLWNWLNEVTSNGRPTLSPSGSEPGGGTTAAPSADASPSTEETPAQ